MSTQLQSEKPWYLSLALGFSAWFAGILLLIGFALMLQPDSSLEFIIIGALLIVASYTLMKLSKEHDFLGQLALCLSIAGQCLLIAGIYQNSNDAGNLALSCLILQVLMSVTMPSRIHRSISALFAVIAWAFWCRSLLLGANFWELIWQSGGQTQMLQSTGSLFFWWLLTWIPVIALCWLMLKQTASRHWITLFNPILRGLLIGLASASFISNFGSLFGAMGASSVAIWSLLSAAAAFVALIFSFMLHSRPLMGFCVACVMAQLVLFYYALDTTLLSKSLLMLVIGIICLGVQQLLKKQAAHQESIAKSRDIL